MMFGSIVAGAIGGLGDGITQVGQMGLEEKREQRLMALREKYQARRDELDREFRTSEREAGEVAARELAEIREQGADRRAREQQTAARALAEIREQGADRRAREQQTAADRRHFKVQGVDAEGRAVWFDPTTERVTQAPEGWNPRTDGPDARGDDWSRIRHEIGWLQDQIEAAEERLAGDIDLTDRDRQSLRDDIRRWRNREQQLREASIARTTGAGLLNRDAGQGAGDTRRFDSVDEVVE